MKKVLLQLRGQAVKVPVIAVALAEPAPPQTVLLPPELPLPLPGLYALPLQEDDSLPPLLCPLVVAPLLQRLELAQCPPSSAAS